MCKRMSRLVVGISKKKGLGCMHSVGKGDDNRSPFGGYVNQVLYVMSLTRLAPDENDVTAQR